MSAQAEPTSANGEAGQQQDTPAVQQAAAEPVQFNAQPSEGATLSKRQMKKQAKNQRLQEMKMARRAAEKAKKKEKQAERQAAFEAMTEEQRAAARNESHAKREARKQEDQLKQTRLKASLADGNQRVVIDLDFEGMMHENDERHLIQQLSYAYNANSKVEKPCHMHLLGLKGSLAERAHKMFPSMKTWHTTLSDKTWNEYFADKLDEVVYLTADSPHELADLDSSKVYVIGGIVDHNRHKGLCYQRAKAAGVATARLPIQQHVKLDTSAVLTVNHVMQVMVEYLNRRDWPAVLDEVLPKRKRADWVAEKKRKEVEESEAGEQDQGTGTGAASEEPEGDAGEGQEKSS